MRGWRAQLLLLAALSALLSCARIKPPGGGPVDKEPARLLASEPADGSRGQGALSEVSLTFDEAVNRESVLDALRMSPRRLLRSVGWEGDTLLTLRFWQDLPESASVDLWLEPGWADAHGVAQTEWQVTSFATGDSLLPGWLGGKATFKGAPSRVLRLELRDAEGGLRRSARPDRQGGFVFRHLPANGRPWRLIAWQDVDGDSLFAAGVDHADSLVDSLILLPASPRRLDLALDVIDPFEPGRLEGRLEAPSRRDSVVAPIFVALWPDSFRAPQGERPLGAPGDLAPALLSALRDRLAATPPGDSLRPAAQWLAAPGDFGFEPVPPGDWWLFAFRDEGAVDSVWDPATEAAALDAGPRRLAPGATVALPRLRLQLPGDSLAAAAPDAEGDGP